MLCIFAAMEFEATVAGETYCFSPLNSYSFLISGPKGEYILYRHSTEWRCAEDIDESILEELTLILNRQTRGYEVRS